MEKPRTTILPRPPFFRAEILKFAKKSGNFARQKVSVFLDRPCLAWTDLLAIAYFVTLLKMAIA